MSLGFCFSAERLGMAPMAARDGLVAVGTPCGNYGRFLIMGNARCISSVMHLKALVV